MQAATKSFRYQLPAKAIKGDCPECGPRHRRTLSRYVDAQTSEPLPELYGRCDRESNCGYHLSPYHKGASGLSYHDELKAMEGIGPIPKTWFRMAGNLKRKGHVPRSGVIDQLVQMEGATPEQAEKVAAFIFDKPVAQQSRTKPEQLVYCIPEEVFQQSLGFYERNQLALLLKTHLGEETATALLQRFQVGTSSRWPGACVFWYIDEQNRKRGGQIKLFGDDFHTVKYKDAQGETRSKTSWVHSALLRRYTEKQEPVPEWLSEYEEKAERSPCLFGLPQIQHAPIDQPVAIVEAPKTAILCTHCFPDFIWMAAGGKSYLNAERLAPLKGRKIVLFPDLNAYQDLVNEKGQVNKGWLTKGQELQAEGFDISVNDYLEKLATDEDRTKGLDLADFLLGSSSDNRARLTYADGEAIYGEVLEVDPYDSYPAAWDVSTTCECIPQLWFEKQMPTARIAHPRAPLAFDAAEQLQRIRWCVIPLGIDEADYNPVLVPSQNRSEYAKILGIDSDQLPLYQLSSQSTQP
ncbi:DUF6371 domain-containing protein [Spirosoma endophyticum]|uniref:Uncharacterized protein n=1 Tax=Spirosoma endophyticum TaxID=662367 RepID=A0A1I2H6K9_9BACT|nr:DUF6371 domain-containing protein [Spirosoma endophyticum]SFF25815.1 hypothetical protein SAMN05216167_13911 [Spirosoma endophyticum]